MTRRPRLTVRARLTLLNTSLFAVCGAIVVVVSYTLMAQLGTSGQSQQGSPPRGVPASIVARCRSESLLAHPNEEIVAKCNAAFQRQGALDQRDLTLSHLLEYSLITVAVVIALAAILGWIAAGRALRPVHRITEAARAASAHNLSARVALRGPRDELRELAETFDEMLGRLQATFEGQQRFIANASHELRTPLAVMRATVDVVLDNPDSTPSDLRSMGADIRIAVDHAEQLISTLLLLARNERGLTVHEDVDLATVAEDALDTAGLRDRRVHTALEPAVISGDSVLIERLIANLLDNADRYNTTGGEIWVSTRTAAGDGQLTMANTGLVISPADADRILQPFQRLSDRTPQDGFGLGLAIVASIAAIHGGTVTASPRNNGGLSVTSQSPRPAPGPMVSAISPPLTPDHEHDPRRQPARKSRGAGRLGANRGYAGVSPARGPALYSRQIRVSQRCSQDLGFCDADAAGSRRSGRTFSACADPSRMERRRAFPRKASVGSVTLGH